MYKKIALISVSVVMLEGSLKGLGDQRSTDQPSTDPSLLVVNKTTSHWRFINLMIW